MKFTLELLGNALIVIAGLLYLYIFGYVWVHNQFVWETSPVILMVLAGLIALMGLERLLCDLLRQEKIREYIGNGIIIAFGGWFAWKGGMMLEFGKIVIWEPNLLILALETIGAMAIVVLGVERMVRDIKRQKYG